MVCAQRTYYMEQNTTQVHEPEQIERKRTYARRAFVVSDSPQRATYFDGFTLTNSENGEALLTGVIADQAALHGVLAKIRDLDLPLLSVNNLANGQARKEQE